MATVHQLSETVELDRKKSGAVKATLTNLVKILNTLQIKVRYNVVFKEVEIDIPNKRFSGENGADAAYGLMTHFCVEQGFPVQHLSNYLSTIAEENSYNPVADWIESKDWDGVSRLEKFYSTIQTEDNDELKKTFMRIWCLAAVAALYEPDGVGARGVLVLQGEQYMGKTNWFRNLVPKEVRKYIKDGLTIDPSDRDSKKTALSYWLVELGEIGATLKAGDKDTLKAFLSSDRDSFRVAYGRGESKFPRRTVFCGSINEKQFLRDRTGNSRFFVVPCTAIDHEHGIDMQQLWAEFKAMYDNGDKWFMTQEEFQQVNDSNEKYMLTDPLEEKIRNYYDWENYFVTSKGAEVKWRTATQIIEEIGWKSVNRSTVTSCALIMRKLNFSRTKILNGTRLIATPLPRVADQPAFPLDSFG